LFYNHKAVEFDYKKERKRIILNYIKLQTIKKMKKFNLLVSVIMLFAVLLSACKSNEPTPIVGEKTIENLKAAITGESNASVLYAIFSQKAKELGLNNIATMFAATSEAEKIHVNAHQAVLKELGVNNFVPVIENHIANNDMAKNLEDAIAGETYEFTEMYPKFIEVATAENIPDAVRSFERAMKAEMGHAKHYQAVLEIFQSLGHDATVSKTWYICPTCGDLEFAITVTRCPICGVNTENFIEFKNDELTPLEETIENLKAAITGESNASAMYAVFSQKAKELGLHNIATMFAATSEAEKIHVDAHQMVLKALGVGNFEPVIENHIADNDMVKNLEDAIAGETYEFTVMYPKFIEVATAANIPDAVRSFERAMKAEMSHAEHYQAVLEILQSTGNDSTVPGTWYICPTCGDLEFVITLARCPICGVNTGNFIVFN
jgi:rubrerythrin